MARIRTIAAGTQKVQAHPTEVDCYYNIIDEGETLPFVLTHCASHLETPQPINPVEALAASLGLPDFVEFARGVAFGHDGVQV